MLLQPAEKSFGLRNLANLPAPFGTPQRPFVSILIDAPELGRRTVYSRFKGRGGEARQVHDSSVVLCLQIQDGQFQLKLVIYGALTLQRPDRAARERSIDVLPET